MSKGTKRVREKRKLEHYVNNKDFSQAVIDYSRDCNAKREQGLADPMVTDYIAQCLLRICEGLSHKSNFVRYTYREEMVMDAVENCLKAVSNYNADAATRGGKPNAFGYFTQIAWFAFLRRIQKEKRQQDIKLKFLAESNIDDLPGAVHAAEHAAIGLLPLFASCDRWDIGGVSTIRHPDTGLATIFIYDGLVGGAGFSFRGAEIADEWLGATASAVRSCVCTDGCPSCVQSPKCGNGNDPLSKDGAQEILQILANMRPGN